jgi:hypothetical protein
MERKLNHLGIVAWFEWKANLQCFLKVESLQTTNTRYQLRMYEEEVQTFQASFKGLKVEV